MTACEKLELAGSLSVLWDINFFLTYLKNLNWLVDPLIVMSHHTDGNSKEPSNYCLNVTNFKTNSIRELETKSKN